MARAAGAMWGHASVVYHCPRCDVRAVDSVCWVCGGKLVTKTLAHVNGPRMRPPGGEK
jgi:hypothetical protein